ncbi:MAG: hypothetical protein MR436_04800 [Eubacterium sp.]|nr:hypothetical protein [Eubacterium sp.]
MRRTYRRIQLTKEGKKAAACIAAGAALLALLLFFLLFRVTSVEVVGSTKYTDEEIKGYALESPLTSNTVLAMTFKSHMEADNIPFVESFDLERLSRQKLRIHVNEKKIIGYIVEGTDKLYFDKDGLVVELVSMDEEEIAQMESEQTQLEELKQQAEAEEALQRAKEAEAALTGHVQEEEDDGEEGESQPVQEVQMIQAEEVNQGNENATEFHAAVTDVPRVLGITEGSVSLGEKIDAVDQGVFNTVLGITRMVEKYGILPEIVLFNENLEITLVYQEGNIHCELGKDTLLEEKITRVAAIMPKMKEYTGILHLEDYTEDTTNIIFSKESLYTLKSRIAEAGGMDESDPAEYDVPTEGDAAQTGDDSQGTEGNSYDTAGNPTE